MKTLLDKVVVITGAASGIGRALACEAARRGARLALADWNEIGLAETMTLLRSERGRSIDHVSRRIDVRHDAQVTSFADEVERLLGGADVIVNNAGVSLSDTIGSMSRSDFEWLFDINFWGTVRGTEAFLPQLSRRSDAHVVNVSSVFGLVAAPGQSAYNASKFAVRGYTEALRQELGGSSIHVTCVHPGGVRTNIVRNGRHHRNWRNEATTTETAASEFAKMAWTSPGTAAQVIWSGVLGNAPRVLVGHDAWLIDRLQRTFPSRYPSVIGVARRLLGKALRHRT